MIPIDPARFAALAEDLAIATETHAEAHVVFDRARVWLQAADRHRQARKQVLIDYVQQCAGARFNA